MPQHLLSVDQFDQQGLKALFALTTQIKQGLRPQVPQHTVSANLFYESSTRTSSSFLSAMAKLGGSVIPINDVNYSSVSKGETLEDTVRTLSCYSDVIVLRHPQEGAAARAAEVSEVPIINAGDGVGEHPTQALLDFYTITEKFGWQQPLRIAMVGDLLHGRTVHSLIRLLRHRPCELVLVSPPSLSLPAHRQTQPATVLSSLSQCIEDVDVIYMTRVQKERINNLTHVQAQGSDYALTAQLMQRAQAHTLVMHPMPRVDEIDRAIDTDPRAVYFEQIANGLFVRQAIFANLLVPQSEAFWR
jgi:aspartate carbamoyltransferase catalytic subunit